MSGQLRIAGGQGLARYDGRVIEIHDRRRLPLLGSDEVRSLLPEPDGGLVIGVAAGRILRRSPDVAGGRLGLADAGGLAMYGVDLQPLSVLDPPATPINPGTAPPPRPAHSRRRRCRTRSAR